MYAHVLGFPRMGQNRELKWSLEKYWRGEIPAAELLDTAQSLKERHWAIQAKAGMDAVAVGDHSLYDHVLDATVMLGAIPPRFGQGAPLDLGTYFRLARGDVDHGVPPMEMTKWFDTNYHYMVPELTGDTVFTPDVSMLVEDVRRAAGLGYVPKPVLVGPVTYLMLSKGMDGSDPLDHLDDLAEAYASILSELEPLAPWVQIDEPGLVTDLPPKAAAGFGRVYERLRKATDAELLLTTYFGGMGDNLDLAMSLPVDGIHLDLVRGPDQLDRALDKAGGKTLSLGLVDGRNIWRTDLDSALEKIKKTTKALGSDLVMVASSCSLLHSPVDIHGEDGLDPEIKAWMAFATQKCAEVAALKQGDGPLFEETRQALKARDQSPKVHDPAVERRMASVDEAMLTRATPVLERAKIQQARLNLPLLPTTTIGSFPQTPEIRKTRLSFKRGEISEAEYKQAMQGRIREVIAKQEELGLDVLVHGEPERNDMVEYFGQQMNGFCFTSNGWVQSYGSRCVKPPVIFGDVSRPEPMTVEWLTYAKEQTDHPMKGMLTGPVTILCWSFVRDDLPRSEVCRQIALAVRDEVVDLEAAGLPMVQIDEAALREGMPLRASERDQYLKWAVDSFRLTAGGVHDETQIHSHMCYSEFNVIMSAIARMDADVISIEASRSRMELLEAFDAGVFLPQIGPGVYDIHSPRVPSTDEMVGLLRKALEVVPAERLWVNPDCGLKTRAWPETLASLKNMVEAATLMRREVG